MPELTVHQKWVKEEIPLKEKDDVLISEDNIPRGKWRIGKVTETFPGKDGRIRTIRLKARKDDQQTGAETSLIRRAQRASFQ